MSIAAIQHISPEMKKLFIENDGKPWRGVNNDALVFYAKEWVRRADIKSLQALTKDGSSSALRYAVDITAPDIRNYVRTGLMGFDNFNTSEGEEYAKRILQNFRGVTWDIHSDVHSFVIYVSGNNVTRYITGHENTERGDIFQRFDDKQMWPRLPVNVYDFNVNLKAVDRLLDLKDAEILKYKTMADEANQRANSLADRVGSLETRYVSAAKELEGFRRIRDSK